MFIDNHKEIVQHFLMQHKLTIISESDVKRKQIELNVFGKAFCQICISDIHTSLKVNK